MAEGREHGGEVRSLGGGDEGGEEVGEPGRGGVNGLVEDKEEGAGDESEDKAACEGCGSPRGEEGERRQLLVGHGWGDQVMDYPSVSGRTHRRVP
ncbi:hypothetical protein NL676_021555 [Syzygium grande]|nr:hypothetical protein NL676_021555 [Syzygium grande]